MTDKPENTDNRHSIFRMPGWAKGVAYGDVITIEFFRRHYLPLFVILLLIIIYITTKYQCLTKMEEIQQLENDLLIVKTERMRQQAEYKSRTRESAMQQLVDSVMPGLSIQEQPPYRLTADGQQPDNR